MKGEVGRKEVGVGVEGGGVLLWWIHTKGSFWSLECWAHTCGMKSKPSVNYIKYPLCQTLHIVPCVFYQLWKAPLGRAHTKKTPHVIRIPDTSTLKNSAPSFYFICAGQERKQRNAGVGGQMVTHKPVIGGQVRIKEGYTEGWGLILLQGEQGSGMTGHFHQDWRRRTSSVRCYGLKEGCTPHEPPQKAHKSPWRDDIRGEFS